MFEQAKTLAKDLLGPFYEYVYHVAFALFPFASPTHLHGLFILSTVLLALWFYIVRFGRDQRPTLSGFFGFLVPRRVFLHPSAVVDYKFYVINTVVLAKLKLLSFAAALGGLFAVADGATALLVALFGSHEVTGEPSFVLQLAFTVAMVLAFDFAKWLGHYLEHKVPVLWEFHKVHHSAEVLTPITNHRVHPVDAMVEQFLTALTTGLVAGVFAWIDPRGLTELTLMNIGLIAFFYYLTANLRHSHVPLEFSWRLSHLVSSPAMHQIHHSSEVRHWNKNFALMFSMWDVLARTLYVPRGKEDFRLGLPGEENRRFASVWSLYVAPFVAVARRLARAVGFGPSSAPPQA